MSCLIRTICINILLFSSAKGQDLKYFDFIHTDTFNVTTCYDSDLSDTVYILKIRFDEHGRLVHPKQGAINHIYKNNTLTTSVRTIGDSVITTFYYPSGKTQGIKLKE